MSGNSFFYFISALISLGLYYIAPNQVDYAFQVICFLLFLVQALAVLREDIRREGILSFNLIFLFSFFLVTYAFPLFLIGVTMAQREGIEAYIDFNVSCKCSALSTFAISIYFWSYKRRRKKIFDFSRLIKTERLGTINYIYYVLFVVMIYITVNYMIKVGGIAVESGYWSSLFLACLPLCLIYNTKEHHVRNLNQYLSKNIWILLPSILLMLLYFIIGDRGLVIVSGIVIVSVYSIFVKHVKPILFLTGIIVGSILMFVVRETRTTESALSTGNTSAFIQDAEGTINASSTLAVFSDLTGIHRELYIGYDYVEHNGLLEPMQALIVPFYPLPLVPGIMSQAMFGKTMDDLKPGYALNRYMAYSGHGHFGIHCVIDVYMRWGMLGVIFAFYLWGYMVASLKASRNRNLLGVALYVTLLASAISIPRQPLLDMLRTLSYVIILAWVASLFSKKRKVLNR